jgi:cysteine desulfurase/selenocysteine lyase
VDPNSVRKDFPILQRKVRGKPFIYFDNSCVTLKPKQVIDAITRYYTEYTACHGRSIHAFAAETTREFERAHRTLERLVNAREGEVVFTKNTTEGINIVANGLPWKKGDSVVTTSLEHNSNLIPWLKLQKERGVKHRIVPVGRDGVLDLGALEKAIDKTTRLVSLVYTSNVTGTTLNAREVAKLAHDNGALLMMDAAQTVPHHQVDVKRDDIDFLAWSGHKMLGPSGTGALYGKKALLEGMSQFIVGGETVKDVSPPDWEPESAPMKFEAGLQDYAGASGFAAAADYLMRIGMRDVEKHELALAKRLYEGLDSIGGLHRLGPVVPQGALAAFYVDNMDAHDIALVLDESANIFVRSGQHCTHYYHKTIGVKSTVRPSLYIYNTKEELETFLSKLAEIVKTFA